MKKVDNCYFKPNNLELEAKEKMLVLRRVEKEKLGNLKLKVLVYTYLLSKDRELYKTKIMFYTFKEF